ncbi:helix-turn-helix domain-containing protein [Herbiconiux sp. KACC 21604]|uniref:PucR family transcriptional regulator n=1 Tax=unclassified Herbiconiux TaxID=2618217 RepID=UPI0014912869|nr:helix-turn-helix domain-containing protein [Herbiconiux sp. SALV-R1]QJU52574.1 helix-turn-helix domain-containing protein [Herbiconiux sp. SALV-R1]WPO87456.1 helix-turn-helix domain-containing protein [Herbiconiux sp. KACC 21604]
MVSQSFRYAPNIELLTARAVDLMWDIYEGYSDDVFDKKELIPSVAKNIDLGVRVLRRGSPPTRAELLPGRDLGGRRASQGVPLESVIQAYRSTERTIILDLFSGSQAWPVELTSHYADLIISTFDLLTQEMINSYRETASAIEAAQRRVENELVTAIANGAVPAASDLDRWTHTLRIEQQGPWFSFAIGSVRNADHVEVLRLRQRIAAAVQAYVIGPVLFGDMGRLTVALARPRGRVNDIPQLLARVLEGFESAAGYAIGVGGVSADLVAAQESCEEARDAVAAALGGVRPGRVVQFDDVLVEVLLAREPELASRLVESRLGALREHPHLIDTLEALVTCNHSQAAVAKALFVHPNTVTYRIKRIQELTGFDPLSMAHFSQMATALMWRRMERATS